jgi:hypothetical protein
MTNNMVYTSIIFTYGVHAQFEALQYFVQMNFENWHFSLFRVRQMSQKGKINTNMAIDMP